MKISTDERKAREILRAQRLVKANGCWEWTGSRLKSGYGILRPGLPIPGLVRGRALVTRFAAFAWLGFDLRQKQVIRITCGNHGCFNPQHLAIPSADPKELAKHRLLAKRRITVAECWEWTGHCNASGYGWVPFMWSLRGRQRYQVQAHRLAAYAWLGFELTSSELILHSCDNPSCFNPDHLRPGTSKDNNDDCRSRGRANTLIGEDVGTAKLTTAQVRKIFARLIAGESRPEIARDYGVNRQAITLIARGKNWKSVTGGEVVKTYRKLRPDDVLRIRELHRSGVTLARIGQQFSVTSTTIWDVINGKIWSHVKV